MNKFLQHIIKETSKGLGCWFLEQVDNTVVLAVASPKPESIPVPGGAIIKIGLNNSELLKLRDKCNELLKGNLS